MAFVLLTKVALPLGDRLGEVGNSGASTEPHPQIHAQRPTLEGAPLVLRIDGRFLVRWDRLSGARI